VYPGRLEEASQDLKVYPGRLEEASQDPVREAQRGEERPAVPA